MPTNRGPINDDDFDEPTQVSAPNPFADGHDDDDEGPETVKTAQKPARFAVVPIVPVVPVLPVVAAAPPPAVMEDDFLVPVERLPVEAPPPPPSIRPAAPVRPPTLTSLPVPSLPGSGPIPIAPPPPPPSSMTSQAVRAAPPSSSLPPATSTTSGSLPPASRGRTGGLVVHRSAGPPAPPSMTSGSIAVVPSSSVSASSASGPSPSAPPASSLTSGTLAPVKSEVQEALAALKRAPSSSPPAAAPPRPATIVPASTKAEVQEALAALKPAAPSSMTSGSLPPIRPTTGITIETSGAVPRPETSAPVKRPGFSSPVPPALFKKIAWGVVFASTAVVTVVLLPAPAPPVTAIVDLPVPTLSPQAMPCDRLSSRRRQLDCRLPRERVFALTKPERTARVQETRKLALAAGFERVAFIDAGGTWDSIPTDEKAPSPTTKPPPVVAHDQAAPTIPD